MRKLSLGAVSLIGALAFVELGTAPKTLAQTSVAPVYVEPLDTGTLSEIDGLYRKLIDAENRHDLTEVRTMIWDLPSTLCRQNRDCS